MPAPRMRPCQEADGADEIFGKILRVFYPPEGIEKFTFFWYNQFDILEFDYDIWQRKEGKTQ